MSRGAAWFKVFGSLILLSAAATAWVVSSDTGVRHQGGRDLSSLLTQVYVETPLGFGLFFLRKWAALLFSAALLAVAVWLMVASVQHVPWPWTLVYSGLEALLVAPAIVTWRFWSELKWGGKWFI
jgi:hypothetical protein